MNPTVFSCNIENVISTLNLRFFSHVLFVGVCGTVLSAVADNKNGDNKEKSTFLGSPKGGFGGNRAAVRFLLMDRTKVSIIHSSGRGFKYIGLGNG